MSNRFGPRTGGDTPDFVFSGDKDGNLTITFTQTKVARIIDLNQFVGKLYDYNTILDSILHDYPATASVQITKSAKRALNKQAKKINKAE